MKSREVLAEATKVLTAAGVESARNDAELLLAHVLRCRRGDLLTVEDISIGQTAEFKGLVAKREMRIPLQHITGRAAFRHIEIAVGPGVLTPRPETELVVQAALDYLRQIDRETTRPIVIDLCSGSGAMTASIAIEAGPVDVIGLELEDAAFGWGVRTATDLEAEVAAAGSTLKLLQGDVQGCEVSVLGEYAGRVDVLVSNPPYVPIAAVPRDPEVHLHEPAAALYGGEDGMVFVHSVIAAAEALLKVGGLLVIEHGDVQGEDGEVSVPRLVRAHGSFSAVTDHLDLAGRPRYTTAVRS